MDVQKELEEMKVVKSAREVTLMINVIKLFRINLFVNCMQECEYTTGWYS